MKSGHNHLVDLHIGNPRILDLGTSPCGPDYSMGIHHNVAGTFGWHSTGSSSMDAFRDIVEDGVDVENAWKASA